MSKWRMPTQKGTELWPTVKAGPTIIRIEGVEPGSQEARAMVNDYAPQISHFHRSQAQKYSLSTVDNYRAHATYPGLKMTYTNLQGQERIDIKVTGKSRGRRDKKSEEFYDFVLLDVYVPDDLSQYIYAMGYLTTPLLQEITPGSDTPFPGVALDDQTTFDKMLNAPSTFNDHGTVVNVGSLEKEKYRSFIIDLRPARGLSAVIVDIHAQFEGAASIPIGTRTFGALLSVEGDPAPPLPPYGTLGYTYTPGITLEQWTYTTPAITFNTTSLRWEFVANGDIEIMMDNGVDPIDPTVHSWHPWNVRTGTSAYIPPGSITSVPCEIQATLFKSTQVMEVLNVITASTYNQYYRWGFANRSPPGHLRLRGANIQPSPGTYTTDLFVRRNVPKLGTFIVNQRDWSMSFALA